MKGPVQVSFPGAPVSRLLPASWPFGASAATRVCRRTDRAVRLDVAGRVAVFVLIAAAILSRSATGYLVCGLAIVAVLAVQLTVALRRIAADRSGTRLSPAANLRVARAFWAADVAQFTAAVALAVTVG